MEHALLYISVKENYKLVEVPQLNKTKIYLHLRCKMTA